MDKKLEKKLKRCTSAPAFLDMYQNRFKAIAIPVTVRLCCSTHLICHEICYIYTILGQDLFRNTGLCSRIGGISQ